ncbi:uncharacterized protein FMAN_15181 [Fusarium mangiferae]|uniref:Uncharacterized protein n=1 Tax=Fusarium mangiferae TaxID=192010 RepID=A0A1L7TYB4_FUSMA|nr:uncharacterized protein FMAN_15181 [Fusarium mangiferae]CVL03464.1 uncharacterized protein FMAN_15181 [Fusarium mangiferae]
MDWALVSPDNSRPWSNSLPKEEAWTFLVDDDKPWRIYNQPITDPLHSMEEQEDLGHIYKFGTVTQATIGDIFGEKQDVRLIDDEHLGDDLQNKSTELIIRPELPGKFRFHGDSGSAVVDRKGGIVGLVFRGHKHNGTLKLIQLVFWDTNNYSDHSITDIRVAQP